ncbi:MAG TPA: hypothetical protein VKG23_20450, partial [Thermoanaerobaculia bacterium]|nr:hypothetical protein [Thermoanaerobaculia bacterium]
MGALGVLLLLGAAAWGIRAAAKALGRPIPNGVLAGFVLLSILPYPKAFVTDATPLPLDHVTFVIPWSVIPHGAPYNPYMNDIVTQIAPWTEAIRLAWKDGSWPWRDRWNGCGTPLAANSVSAAFFPVTLAVLLFPLWRGFTLAIALKLLAAAAGMWLWTRELRISASAAAFAAVAYALSFSFLPPWILYPQTGVFCLWPWMLFLVERSRDDAGRGRSVVALAIVFVSMVLAGHPESAALGALFTVLFLVGRRVQGDLPDWPRIAHAIVLAAAVAVGLTAFLLVPAVLAIAASARQTAASTPYWQPHLSAFPHFPLWRGVLPAFFPHTLGNATRSPTVEGGTGTFVEMAMGYAGILCWMAALLVFRPGSPRPRAEKCLWVIALVGFGQAVCLWPVAEIVARTPAFRYIFPLRFNAWMALALPVIAAFELDRYARDLREGRSRPRAIAVSAGVLAGFGVGLYVYLFRLRRVQGGLRFQTWQLAVVLAVLGLAVVLARATWSRPEIFAAVLSVLVGAELLYQWHALNRTYPPSLYFPDTPMLSFLHRQPGVFRVAGKGYVLFPSTNVFPRLEDVRTHDALERRDYMRFLDRTCGYPYDTYFKTLTHIDAPALDFLNVRYVLAETGSAAPGPRWREVYAGTDGTVFENGHVLARAFAPRRVRHVSAPARRPWPVLEAVRDFGPAFDDVAAATDWTDTAWVLDEGGAEIPNPPVEISDYAETTNAASFSTHVSGTDAAYVVLSLVQDGGWTARDGSGRSLPTFLANGPFLAVRLDADTRRVLLIYRPPGLGFGSAIS